MSRQRQMGVVLSDEIRAELELAATRNGCSIGEEIRERLLRTFKQDRIDKPLRNFMAEVGALVQMTRLQTGQNCQTHPAASAVLRHAINARLARTKESGPETFAPGELPSGRRLVAASTDDPQTIGVSLEARLQGILEFQQEDAEFILLEVSWDATQRIIKEKTQQIIKERESKRHGTS
jgi:hypothetical protein